jgi:hypothetical protein
MAWVALGGLALVNLGWTAETQGFYPFRMHVVAGVFACWCVP